jgi:quercetin dioxygenase-like cupin family protein
MEQLPTPKTGKGSAAMFLGDVYVDGITGSDSGVVAAFVHFTPGARNAWHTHAMGQTLHCTEGYGLVVTDDEVIALRPGVTAWTPPGQRHWHAAVPDQLMTHLAISSIPADPSTGAVWGEMPSQAEYDAAVAKIS